MFLVVAFTKFGAKLVSFKWLGSVTWMLTLFVKTLSVVVNLECNVRR